MLYLRTTKTLSEPGVSCPYGSVVERTHGKGEVPSSILGKGSCFKKILLTKIFLKCIFEKSVFKHAREGT